MKSPNLHQSIQAAIQGSFVMAIMITVLLILFGISGHVATWFDGVNPFVEGVFIYFKDTVNNLIALLLMVIIGWMISCVIAIVLSVTINVVQRLANLVFKVKSWMILVITSGSGYLAGYVFESHGTAVLGLVVSLACFYYYLKCWYYLRFTENPELDGHEWLEQNFLNPYKAM